MWEVIGVGAQLLLVVVTWLLTRKVAHIKATTEKAIELMRGAYEAEGKAILQLQGGKVDEFSHDLDRDLATLDALTRVRDQKPPSPSGKTNP